MDEAQNNRTNIISDTKEAATETRRLVFEAILNAPNTRNSGEPNFCKEENVNRKNKQEEMRSLKPWSENADDEISVLPLTICVALLYAFYGFCWYVISTCRANLWQLCVSF